MWRATVTEGSNPSLSARQSGQLHRLSFLLGSQLHFLPSVVYAKPMNLFKNKEVLLIHVMNLCLLIVVGAVYAYDPVTTMQLAGLVGLVWLSVLLIAPKLLKLEITKRWHKDLLQIARNSKWMGLWTGVWMWLYGVLLLTIYLDTSSPLAVIDSALQRETILGTVSMLIFLLLAAISNKWSYAHIKLWKHLNMLVWLVVPFGFTYALLTSLRFTSEWPAPIVFVLFPLMAIAGIGAKFRRDADYFAAMRTALIIGGAFISLLVAYFY